MTADGPGVAGWEGRSEEDWAARLGVPALELHTELPSTNDRARALAREGAPPWTTVVAGSQTAGRGRGGKTWTSPAGAGLWMSVLVPRGTGGVSGVLPLLVGLAGARALEEGLAADDLRVFLKWPNDLIVATGKVGGILCESSGTGDRIPVVAGIGINLRRPPGRLPAVLADEAGFMEDVGIGPVPPDLARGIIREMRALLEPTPDGLVGEAAEEWSLRDHLAGRRVQCEVGPAGVGSGIASDGALLVRTDGGGTVPVRAGSVRIDEATIHVTPPNGDGEE